MIPDYLQQAHDEYRAAIRRVHPENVSPALFIQARDAFLREMDRSEAHIERLQRLLDQSHDTQAEQLELIRSQREFIRYLLGDGRRNSRRGNSPQSPTD